MYRPRERGISRALPRLENTLTKSNLIWTRPENEEVQMHEYDAGSRDRSHERKAHRNFDDKIQYLLSAEEQLLQSISTDAPGLTPSRKY
jgi:hypothetical protein